MGFLDEIEGLAGGAGGTDLTARFHQLVGAAGPNALSQGMTAALSSGQAPPFAQTVSQLFANGSADQKAGMLNRLLASATPEMQAKLTAMIPGATGGPITSGQATGVPSETVQTVASQMVQHNPGVVSEMGSFYSEHPTLVKTLGAAAMMVAMRSIAEHHS